MVKFLYLVAAGIFAHALLPALPEARWLWLLLGIAAAIPFFFPRLKIPAYLLLGLALGSLWAMHQMAHRLPLTMDKADVRVVGTVSSLVLGDDERAAFEFAVAEVLDGPRDLPPLRKLRLSWYGKTALQPGETWQLTARLRSPRGFANPGAFDYEGWLLSEGVSATGYVREGSLNRRLEPSSGLSLAHYRHRLLEQLNAQDISREARGLMVALVLGEQKLIDPDTFRLLQRTGTIHLVVVSGLQIAMITGLCLLIGLGVGRLAVAAGATVPAIIVAVPLALLAALGYSFLAGMGVPVQRALIMSACGLLALVLRRNSHLWHVFGLALLLVALLEPLAALRPGFWLSFTAVLALLAWFSHRAVTGWWRQAIHSQLVVFVCLAPWLVYFQGAVSPWALPLNLITIPWISLSVVPCSLLGALFQGIPPLRDLCWQLAAIQLDWFVAGLEWIAALPSPALVSLPSGNAPVWIVLAAAAVGLMLPRGLGQAVPVAVLLVSLVVASHRQEPEFQLTVLDVGQGLAAVVQVRDRVLVYDTGPGYASGFNTGEAAVLPFLNGQGIPQVDRLVISHGDQDHAGGVAGLLHHKPVADVWAGQSERLPDIPSRPCQQGDRWRWHDVEFQVLWPPAGTKTAAKSNNRSCTLLVVWGDIRLLLPGDIEAGVERQLLASEELTAAPLTLLIAPHHGSKTSSSPAFVQRLAPEHTVFSTGFNHHFGHPHPVVVARYQQLDGQLWNTADSGALQFRWSADGALEISQYRRENHRYWH